MFLDDSGNVEAVGDFYLKGVTGKYFDEFDLPTISTFPPEYFTKGDEPNSKSDIWQLGVLLYEISTGKLPFYNESLMKVKRNIV